jgi:hypothetical protein
VTPLLPCALTTLAACTIFTPPPRDDHAVDAGLPEADARDGEVPVVPDAVARRRPPHHCRGIR